MERRRAASTAAHVSGICVYRALQAVEFISRGVVRGVFDDFQAAPLTGAGSGSPRCLSSVWSLDMAWVWCSSG